MPSLTEQREAALHEARAIAEGAKAAGRNLSPDEVALVNEKLDAASDIDVKIAEAKGAEDLMSRLAALPAGEDRRTDDIPVPAKSLGEHYTKSGLAEQAKTFARGARATVSAPEFVKAATDPLLSGDVAGGLQTQYGSVYETRYRRLTVADLMASGTLSAATLTYWTQGTLTGDVGPVAEGALKPSLNFDFGAVTEVLSKIAGVTKVSDEMTQDADFMVSVIRSQLLARLGIIEEDQLVNGNGTAPNVRGIANRSGIQTYATPATSTAKKTLDGILHAINLVRNNSFIEPDGIIINPTDYENIRLGVDGQSQYYGGGPFTGAYGNNGFELTPAVWGLPTAVTPVVAAGTVFVGGFKTACQVFRKGGVRLEMTNSNEDDFKRNLVALRIEERLALAVYFPPAIVKVTITA